jgi:Putative phage metallopeptidase
MLLWHADKDILQILDKVKTQYHHPRLEQASVALCFNDSSPFLKGRFNWGKTSKFSAVSKLFQDKKYDFLISLCGDAWHSVLASEQREALLDLHLTRCEAEYEAEIIEENGKKIPVKDKWGRIQYTNVMKVDDEGFPRWKVLPLDLDTFTENVVRFGCWCQNLLDFKSAIKQKENERREILAV